MRLVKHFSLKYKILAVILFILFAGLGAFGYFAQRTFSQDKRLFVMDLNQALLDGATTRITLEIRSRLEIVQIVSDLLLRSADPKPQASTILQGLPENVTQEILRLRIYEISDKNVPVALRTLVNPSFLAKRKLKDSVLDSVDSKFPINLAEVFSGQEMRMFNRSMTVRSETGQPVNLPLLTFALKANPLDGANKKLVVTVDFLQDFLVKVLQRSEVAELFLMQSNGHLLSHAREQELITYSGQAYPHPVADRIRARHFPKESMEVELNGDRYLCNVAETGFPDLFIVSQVSKSAAFQALRVLLLRGLVVGVIIAYFGLVIGIIFSRRLTRNIRKLEIAAEEVSRGNFDIKLDIRGNDEVKRVSTSFEEMTRRIQTLIQESAEKGRMEQELKTAQLVQSTLLAPAPIDSNRIEIAPYYLPASECGGDYFDSSLQGSKLTTLIGDATGHGAGAGIVTALAKSCFSTLCGVYQSPLLPEQFLLMLNRIIHQCMHGKVLMTMTMVQLDVGTGEVVVATAGHESPMWLTSGPMAGGKKSPIPMLARGERLGFDPNSQYQSQRYQLVPGDSVLLYTDGISEAQNAEGREWGERALKKVFSTTLGRPVAESQKLITSALQAHVAGARQADDITFVLVKWLIADAQVKPPPIPAKSEIAA